MSVVRGLPRDVYIVASFKIGAEARHYEEIESELSYEGCKIAELKGLSEAEIGEWIRRERGVEFLKPELRKIRRESGGFPVLLNEWISQSEELNSDELKGERKKSLFNFYEKRLDKVDDNTQVFARKLSVLLQPLTLEEYTRLVKEDGFTKEDCDNHIRRLIQAQIFSGDKERWFKHELMQEYVRDENIGDELRKIYHEYAALFFEERYKNAVEKGERVDSSIALGCAHHFHHAGLHKQSYSHNVALANFSFDTGSLDTAETCYLRAIEDAKELGDDKGIAIQRGNLANVYSIWGRLDDALNTNQELYDYFKEKGNKRNEAVALHQIGMIHQNKGEYEKALEKYTKSLKSDEEIGDKSGIALTLGQIGRIKHGQEKYHEAISAFANAASIFKVLGSPYFELAIKDLAAIKEEIGEDKFNEILQELDGTPLL